MHSLATYLRELRDIRSSGANVSETSFYGPLANLLSDVGRTLKPRVRCIIHPKNQGAGIPDGGFFTADQLPRTGEPDLHAPLPARGVMEVKAAGDDAWQTARSAQVARYLDTYGQVLVTNYRDFVLLGRDASGKRVELEAFFARFAADQAVQYLPHLVQSCCEEVITRSRGHHRSRLPKSCSVRWDFLSL